MVGKNLTCDQALFSFRLVKFHSCENAKREIASDLERVNKSDAKIRPDRRLERIWYLLLSFEGAMILEQF